MQRILIIIISCVIAAGCASSKNSSYDYLGEEDLYQKARQNMISRKFVRAQEAFQMLEARFPFGKYAEQAQLEIISAYYQGNEYDQAVAAADRFVRLHPEHPEVDFALYYKGLSNFDANRTLFDRFFNIDLSERDPGTARDSYNDFSELATRFPESRFAADARARMVFLRNILSRHEIHVADYYLKRGAYTAAVNRGRFVVEHYQETTAAGDGLAIMVQAYKLMDMPELANDSLAVLKKNYPSHESLDRNGNFLDKFSIEETEKSRKAKDSKTLFSQPSPSSRKQKEEK